MQDFDLCLSCYKEVTHPHPMDRLGLGLELDNSQLQDQASQKDPKEQRKASVEKCIWFLVHATQCHNPHCKQPSCIKMKRVLTHTRECKLMLSGKWNQCTVCKQFVLLCISHAKSCNVEKCLVPVCARIKKNLRDQRNQRSVQANRFMQQRMAQMHSAAATAAQTSVASPAPTNTSPGNNSSSSNPTSINSPSKAKGSPSTHPSNPASNKPYMNAPSPATGPLSVGKGGPRTPSTVPGKAGLMANSPVVPTPSGSVVAGKPDASPNMILQAASGLPEEFPIRKIGPATSGDQFARRDQVMNMRPNAGQMRINPAIMNRQAPGQEMMGHPTMNHMGGSMYAGMSQIQSQPNPIIRVPQPMPTGNFPNQMSPQQQQVAMMRHHHQQQQQSQFAQYRGMQRMMAQPGNQVYSSMGAHQHGTQLERILAAPQPQHHHQYNQGGYISGTAEPHHPQYMQQTGYMQQMGGGGGSHPPLGPPPQYPANRAQPGGGYGAQMPGAARPGMGEAGMQIGAGSGGGSGYMYPQQYSSSNTMLNNSNSNNNSNSTSNSNSMLGEFNSLPPQDQLSRFVEHL